MDTGQDDAASKLERIATRIEAAASKMREGSDALAQVSDKASWVQLVVGALLAAALSAGVSWVGYSMSTRERLTSTERDVATLNREMDEMHSLLRGQEQPPAWFKAQVERLEGRIERLEGARAGVR